MLAYLHIPFCDSKCHYCSFNSYVDKFDTRSTYMKSLCTQLAFELERFKTKTHSIETVFIGGGTPSTVEPREYAPLFKLLNPYLKEDAEITTEANPNSATIEWLEGMKSLGVNRVSFGVQSFNNEKLKSLNRAHSSKQAKQAILNAKAVGYKHISLDLIYNCQGDTEKLILNDIETAFSLPIDHISAYELTIEDGTKFSTTPEVKQENDALAFFVADEIKKRGFTHYEISNFGNYQSLHNRGYWELKNYIGAGAGAVGFLEDKRFYPQTNIDAYISNPLKISEELLTKDELLTEKLFLGFRSNIGVCKSLLNTKMQENAALLQKEGKLRFENGKYFNKNFFLSDEVVLFVLGK